MSNAHLLSSDLVWFIFFLLLFGKTWWIHSIIVFSICIRIGYPCILHWFTMPASSQKLGVLHLPGEQQQRLVPLPHKEHAIKICKLEVGVSQLCPCPSAHRSRKATVPDEISTPLSSDNYAEACKENRYKLGQLSNRFVFAFGPTKIATQVSHCQGALFFSNSNVMPTHVHLFPEIDRQAALINFEVGQGF